MRLMIMTTKVNLIHRPHCSLVNIMYDDDDYNYDDDDDDDDVVIIRMMMMMMPMVPP